MTNTLSSTRLAQFEAKRRPAASANIFVAAALLLSFTAAHQAQAQPLLAGQQPYRERESRSAQQEEAYNNNIESRLIAQSMRNRRVMMVLPLRAGENWKSTPEFTQSFLRQTDSTLRRALNDSNRFSLLEVRRFNPVLMRAVQDGVVSSDDLTTLLAQPSTPNASTFLSKINFDRAPLQASTAPAVIGSFVLESMSMADNMVNVKVTGRMYPANGQAPLRALSATASVPYNATNGTTAAADAASMAINRVIGEFVRTATANEILTGETPSLVTPAVVPVQPVAPESTLVLPGKPIKGSSNSLGAGLGVTSTQTSVIVVPNLVTEVPPAETFATAASNPETGVTSGDVGSTEGATTADTDLAVTEDSSDSSTGDTTVIEDSTVIDTTNGTLPDISSSDDTSSGEAVVTDNQSPSSNNPTIVNPTATDDAANVGTTDDGTESEGTVGAMSNESNPKIQPPSFGDDGLAFER